jgi:hypothetical protein
MPLRFSTRAVDVRSEKRPSLDTTAQVEENGTVAGWAAGYRWRKLPSRKGWKSGYDENIISILETLFDFFGDLQCPARSAIWSMSTCVLSRNPEMTPKESNRCVFIGVIWTYRICYKPIFGSLWSSTMCPSIEGSCRYRWLISCLLTSLALFSGSLAPWLLTKWQRLEPCVLKATLWLFNIAMV